jgi:hypothetical protein
MSGHISIQGWEQLQHYKDRNPTWVKLYQNLLTSESWVLGTDLSRLVQVASMLLAARYKNEIPYRWDLIKKVAGLDCTEKAFEEAIRHLEATSFLTVHRVATPASTALAQCSTHSEGSVLRGEERREEKSRGEKNRSVELKLDRDPVERIFEHWRSEFRHPKAGLDPKRRRAIQRSLEAYDEDTLKAAISGYKLSPHHMGQNDQRTVYDDISLFLRDAEHIDRGLNFARAPPTAVKSAVEIARENLRKNINGSESRVVSEQTGRSGDGGMGSLARLLR